MEKFEEAVLLCSDPRTDDDVKKEALMYLKEFENSDEGLILCLKSLEENQFDNTHVLFHCLKVVEKSVRKRGGELRKNGELEMVQSFACSFYENPVAYHFAARNKVAEICAVLFAETYLGEWRSFFSDLVNKLGDSPSRDALFIQIMKTIDEVVVVRDAVRDDSENERNSAIKDAMREGDAEILVGAFADLVEGYAEGDINVACEALDVLASYVEWVDISLIVTERFKNIVEGAFSYPQLGDAAARFLSAILTKGMLGSARLEVLSLFNVVDLLQEKYMSLSTQLEEIKLENNTKKNDDEDNDISGDEDPERLVLDSICEVAKCLNVLVESLLNNMMELEDSPTFSQLSSIMNLAIRIAIIILGHEDDGVAECVVSGIVLYIQHLRMGVLVDEGSANFDGIVAATLVKMRFDGEDEFENEETFALFEKYRHDLKSILTNLKNINIERLTELACNFAMECFDGETWMDIELGVHIAFVLLEIAQEQPFQLSEGEGVGDEGLSLFGQLLEMVCNLQLNDSFHEVLVLKYFEVVGRLNKFMLVNEAYLQACIGSFFSTFGMSSENRKIRSRSCYLFSVLLRDANVRNALDSYVFEILSSVLPLIQEGKKFGEHNELNLIEAIGWLLTLPALSNEEKKQYLDQYLDSLLEQMVQLMTETYPTCTSARQREDIVASMCHVLSSIERISKGFGKLTEDEDEDVRSSFMNAVDVVSQAVTIHERALMAGLHKFVHRMISLLDVHVAPFLHGIISGFLQYKNCEDVEDISVLFVHLIKKFKDVVAPLINTVLEGYIQQVFSVTDQDLKENEMERKAEQRSLLKSFYSVIAVIVNNNLSGILVSEENVGFAPDLLQAIMQGASSEDNGPREQKCCFSILRSLMKQWLTEDGDCVAEVQGLIDWLPEMVSSDIVNTCFTAISSPSFCLSDAQSYLVVGEAGAAILYIYGMYGERFLEYLQDDYLPMFGLGEKVVQQFIQKLQECFKQPRVNSKKMFAKQLKSIAEQIQERQQDVADS
eukprot:m.30454 g.30454  ORF g.30454 m.30454 type:complete len:1007 (+) comp6229_c0_seq1:102-3122(+)